MKRRWTAVALALAAAAGLGAAFLAMGSLASIDSPTPPAGEKELDLGLIILVNRLQLTPEQLTAVRDRLQEVVNQGKAIEAKRTAFAKEMLTFTGDEAAVEVKLAAFRKEMNALWKDLTATAKENVEELKGLLTIRQGEILHEALPDWPALEGSRAAVRLMQGRARLQAGGAIEVERWGFDALSGVLQTGPQTAKKGALLERVGPMLGRLAENAPRVAERLQQLQNTPETPSREGLAPADRVPMKLLQKLEDLLDILNQRAALRAA